MKHRRGTPCVFHTSRAPKIYNLFFVYREFIEEKFDEFLHEPSGEFDNFCRMTFADFEILLSKISPIISKQDTDFREAIPAKFRLIMTLRFLASGDSYRSLHYLFKVSKASLSGIIRKTFWASSWIIMTESIKEKVSPEEWETRVQLAAAYRLVAHYGWDDLIFTHISARVPNEGHHFLINPYGFLFERNHGFEFG